MSTVQTFQGHEGRNSSRVLAPPGGRSNIFFSDENAGAAPIVAGGRRNMAQSANRNASNLFGAPEPVKPVVAAPVAQPTTTEVVSAPAPVVAAASSPAAVAPAARITSMEGQQETAIPAGKHRDVHTSSRVLAPPGGHCHKIFG